VGNSLDSMTCGIRMIAEAFALDQPEQVEGPA
jgi:hypothetical protein